MFTNESKLIMKKITITLTLILLLLSCKDSESPIKIDSEKKNYTSTDSLHTLDINIHSFKNHYIQKIIKSTNWPYNLEINWWWTKEDNTKISAILKTLSLKSLDVQYLDDYEDKKYYILNNLDTSKIESIRLIFYGINKEQWLEKTLQILKEKINNSPNLENFKYLSLDIDDYRFTEEELQIISEIKMKHFWYNDDEELIPEKPLPKVTAKEIEQRRKNIENDIREKYESNPMHSKSDDIVKKLLLNSPYLKEILYWDYRWFRKENWKITYSEN